MPLTGRARASLHAFADTDHENRWVEECRSQLSAIDHLTGTVVPHGEHGFCIAVIAGIDLHL